MDLLALETEDELREFNALFTQNSQLFDSKYYYNIGGIVETIADYKTWHWVATAQPIKIQLPFGPGEPNNVDGLEHCLSLEKKNSNHFVFNDIHCSIRFPTFFICQQITQSN